MTKRVWPKEISAYLIMPITFPIWVLLRIFSPETTDTYFIDRERISK